ncbi:CS domain protein, putative [Plasmodium ovale wallikeri]|uniref:Nuclear migration protein nudC n=2 Tax=Plasmodium ovale TaxID=36330 RepID=A0A1A8ZVA3_PLAOA|nr:CS domain protein, putative [Plasmodium ovale wallikeri]SBT48508.1 CS domain protein, putative [Plasmodium ovale wallikeri]SBT82421.1 CS domain protein, putative [Plasmodium ovale]
MDNEKHESMLMAIARDFKCVDDLMETFLSFLENKTDYFHLMISDDDVEFLSKKYDGVIAKNILNNNACGFKANTREHKLMKLFRKHQLSYIIKKQPYIIENEEMKNKYLTPCEELKKLNNIKICEVKNITSETQKKTEIDTSPVTISSERHISTWNGGKTEKYFWNQALNEINIEIPLHTEIKTSEIKVDISNKNIKVFHLSEVKLEGTFYEEVNKQECMWSIEDKKKIIISLEKKRENWWPCVLKGDPEIDTSKIESKKNLIDFDEKTQGEIRKFLHKQKLKSEGIKSPEEIREQALLKNVLNRKGYPFAK